MVVEGREKCGDGLCGRSFVVPAQTLEGSTGRTSRDRGHSPPTAGRRPVLCLICSFLLPNRTVPVAVTEWYGSGGNALDGLFYGDFPSLWLFGGNVLVAILVEVSALLFDECHALWFIYNARSVTR